MLKIKLKTDANLLARVMVYHSCFETVDYANYLWLKYNNLYRFLKVNPTTNKIKDKALLKEIKSQPYYKKLLNSSKQNLKRIQTNWNNKKAEINAFLNKILKKEINLTQTGYIVSSNINEGSNINNTSFVYGAMKGEKDANYDLVYLVHESLHAYFERTDLAHALIEKIADIELARFLGNKFYEGHNFLKEYHEKIFPYWNLYLNRTPKEIESEMKLFNINYDIKKFEPLSEKLASLNIDEFLNFLHQTLD